MDVTEDPTTILAQPSVTAIVLFALAALGLVLWIGLGRGRHLSRLSTHSFWCPLKGRNVTAEFLEVSSDGTPIAVKSCDAFSPPSGLACNKVCLRLTKLPPPRPWAAGGRR